VLGPGSLIGEMALVDGERPLGLLHRQHRRGLCRAHARALEALIAEQPATAAKLMTASPSGWPSGCAKQPEAAGHAKLVQTMQQEIDVLIQVLGAVLALQIMVMARMPSTTPSDTATGILKMSISIILVPMNTRITARP
jgi:hypothetical protein